MRIYIIIAGVAVWSEIIPVEPDPDNTGVGSRRFR